MSLPPEVRCGVPAWWLNPRRLAGANALDGLALNGADLADAHARWVRFAPVLTRLFPDTLGPTRGRVESPLLSLSTPLAAELTRPGARILVKADHDLPLAGSIKARGGIYEVLVHAEAIAIGEGLISATGDPSAMISSTARQRLGQYRIVVGSTGNLGISVGLAARGLGLAAEVHMSAEAKAWKKQKLREAGATVIEHEGDYSQAVAAARTQAAADPTARFVDDERSQHLFLGYATAGRELGRQLAESELAFTPDDPLVVLLPCGVGGAPGGIIFGLRHEMGDNVRCVLVEPIESPAMLVQLASGLDDAVSVYDVGRTNATEADGLAVPVASMFAARMIERLVTGAATVGDQPLFVWARRLWLEAGIRIEPSAAAGFAAARAVVESLGADEGLPRAPRLLVWSTGGGLLPESEHAAILERGSAVNNAY